MSLTKDSVAFTPSRIVGNTNCDIIKHNIYNLKKKVKHNIAKKKGTKLKSRLSKKKEISLELTDLRIGVARTLTLHAWLLVVLPNAIFKASHLPMKLAVHGLDVVVVGVL